MVRHDIGKSLAFFVALVCCAGGSFAQTPLGSGFTYQGQLSQSGSPVNATVDFDFRLWDAATGGNIIGSTATADGVSIVDGLFTVQLDFGVAVFNGDARWLEVSVANPSGGVFTTLSPRQPLTAVPYSLQTRGIYVNNAGNVGIGTTTPGAKLGVVGDIRVSGKVQSSAGPLDLSGGGAGVSVNLDEDGGSSDTFVIFDTGVERFRVDGNTGTVTAPAFVGNGAGLTGIPGDDLGSHTATQALDMNSFDIHNAATVTATAFSGDGSALTNIPGDNLGDHTATQTLDMNSSDINNAGTVSAELFVGDGSGLTGVSATRLASNSASVEIGNGIQMYTRPTSLDQVNEANGPVASPGSAWQSFTAGMTGDLAAIAVRRSVAGGVPGSAARVRIYEGEGTSGALLGTSSIPTSYIAEWQTAAFPSPTPIVAGNQYTLALDGTSQLWWVFDNPGTYGGGIAGGSPDWDYAFRTYVADDSGEHSPAMVADTTGNIGIGTTTPAAKLHVEGEIQFGAGQALIPIADTQAMAVVHGHVETDGTLSESSPGLTVTRIEEGLYQVDYAQNFSLSTTVNVTPIISAQGDIRIAMITSYGSDHFTVRFRNPNGVSRDSAFYFMVIGGR